MKDLKISSAYIQFSKWVSVIPAILSSYLWTRKVFYRALIYLIFRITSILGSILFCLISLREFPSSYPTIFLNSMITVFAWRNNRPSTLKFSILFLLVSFIILEFVKFAWTWAKNTRHFKPLKRREQVKSLSRWVQVVSALIAIIEILSAEFQIFFWLHYYTSGGQKDPTWNLDSSWSPI